MHILPSPIAVFALSTCAVSSDVQQLTPQQREVWQAIRRGWDALRAEDLDGFMRTFHPQFLGWNMSRPVPLDVAAERAGTMEFLAAYDWVSYQIDPVAVRVVDDNAVVHYRYVEVVRRVSDQTVHHETGRVTQVLKRHEGQWKTLTIMSGPAPTGGQE